ncbi:response regulator transcription factor [Chryseolinea lacunae]|uniref:Response regulator transcription factor n=1 Tax=Chryseolinea lacunae TaxID=2801331 RepID=A0ABS1KP90_9BACT|nr:response regulator transcription factor [Chryseolinea lacunae]MBL0741077.1 response regulator transcription factor [Chryseolinea lacunae]
MNLLLIEDNNYKIEQLQTFLNDQFLSIKIETKKSYHSGLKELLLNNIYDLVLLDISMPTYDIKPGEPGGDPMPLAGKLLLNEMYLRDIKTKVIVVTMYESFVDGTKLSALDKQLHREFSENYKGFVYFSPGNTNWKENLLTKIHEVI